MDRRELVRRMVLNAICDDFENVDQIILPVVAEDCGKLGFIVERSEIVGALTRLVEDGLAKAYDLHNLPNGDPFSGELGNMPSLDQVEEYFKTYFYITKKGMDFHTSDDMWWPFHDNGERRPNWHLDERPISD
jgi:hypothetical protein